MAAFELSGAQVSTAPTASFPPTGMGLLMAPLRWAQMSLGDVMQQCQAGALGALGEGLPHGPPNPLASVGENQHLANGRAAPQPLRNSASLGPWGKAKHVLSLQTPQICLGRQLPAGPQAGPALGLPPLGRLSLPPQSESTVHFTLDLDLGLYLASRSLPSIGGAQPLPAEQGRSLVGVVNLTFLFVPGLQATLVAASQPPGLLRGVAVSWSQRGLISQ